MLVDLKKSIITLNMHETINMAFKEYFKQKKSLNFNI